MVSWTLVSTYCSSLIHFNSLQLICVFSWLLYYSARQTFKEATADVHDLVKLYSNTYNLPIKLVYTPTSQYQMQLGEDFISVQNKRLPAEFINSTKKRKQITFTSLKLVSLFTILCFDRRYPAYQLSQFSHIMTIWTFKPDESKWPHTGITDWSVFDGRQVWIYYGRDILIKHAR